MGYFSFSDILLLVLRNILNYVFTWKKIIIFLFLDILGTKCQSAIWGQRFYLFLSQVRCPRTVPLSVRNGGSCQCPQDWNGHGHSDTGMPRQFTRHLLVGPGEHPIPHPGPPGHSLDPCGMVRRTGLVYSSRVDHQVSPRQCCLQDLCTSLSPVLFLILLSATLIPPFAYNSLFPNKQQSFFTHGCQFCYIYRRYTALFRRVTFCQQA